MFLKYFNFTLIFKVGASAPGDDLLMMLPSLYDKKLQPVLKESFGTICIYIRSLAIFQLNFFLLSSKA